MHRLCIHNSPRQGGGHAKHHEVTPFVADKAILRPDIGSAASLLRPMIGCRIAQMDAGPVEERAQSARVVDRPLMPIE